MPRTKVGIPWAQQELEEELRKRYGGYLTKPQIAQELGISLPTAYKWVEGMSFTKVGHMKKYAARDVAKKIYESRGN